jgi:hypothetical protein
MGEEDHLSVEGVDDTTKHSISAYAYKQAAIYPKLVNIFIGDWYWSLESRSLGSSWLQDYPVPPLTKRQCLVSNVQIYHLASALSNLPTDANDPETSVLGDDPEMPTFDNDFPLTYDD